MLDTLQSPQFLPSRRSPSAVSPAGLWFHVLHSQLPMKMRERKPIASDRHTLNNKRRLDPGAEMWMHMERQLFDIK